MSQPLPVRLALLVSLVLMGLTAALALAAVGARVMLSRRERRRREVLAVWRPLLVGSLHEIPQSIPRARPADRLTVLTLWNHLQESLRDSARERLVEVARRAGFEEIARRMLPSGNRAERLVGVTTLGNMGIRAAWSEVSALVGSGRPVLAAAAARALVRIDPKAAADLLTPILVGRTDWHPALVAGILAEAGADVAADAIAGLLPTVDIPDVPRLVRYLEATRNDRILPIVDRILESATDPEVEAACLRAIGEFRDPRTAPIVRRRLSHPVWFVRLQAAAALGKVGTGEDEEHLAASLTDPEWWVRYRAAEALASLPSMTPERLAGIRASQTDRYARDALALVAAERAGL